MARRADTRRFKTQPTEEALLKRAKGIAKRCAIGKRNLNPRAALLAQWGAPVGNSERFWRRVKLHDESGCLVWTGTPHRVNGQGYFHARYADGRQHTITVQRFAYEERHGKQPSNLMLYRLCGNVLCVNPDHMELVTRTELMTRVTERKRDEKALRERLEDYTDNPLTYLARLLRDAEALRERSESTPEK